MKKYSLVIASAIVALLFLKFMLDLSAVFRDFESKQTASLVRDMNPQDMEAVLLSNGYASDSTEAALLTAHFVQRLRDKAPINSLGDLNMRAWQIPARLIDSAGSPVLRARLAEARAAMGIDSLSKALDMDSLPVSVVLDSAKRGGIEVFVSELKKRHGPFDPIVGPKRVPCEGVAVRLSEHTSDSSRTTPLFLKTDTAGIARFGGLDPEKSYCVFPVCDTLEYDMTKGAASGILARHADKDGILRYAFTQQEQRIRPFDDATLARIGEEHLLTVRTPEVVRYSIFLSFALFFAVWWCVRLSEFGNRMVVDRSILALLFLLTGAGLLATYAAKDPLDEPMLGDGVAQGIILGTALAGLFKGLNFTEWYLNRSRKKFDLPLECVKWFFIPYRQKMHRLSEVLRRYGDGGFIQNLAYVLVFMSLPLLLIDLVQLPRLSRRIDALLDRLPKGSGYLAATLLLTALLFTPSGIEAGGMRTTLNLGLKIQTSEIAKFFMVIFTAAFFTVNADRIARYSDKGNAPRLGEKLGMLALITTGLALFTTLGLLLGNMGYVMVSSFTFLLLYSTVKTQTDLKNIEGRERLRRILTCDLAILLYGVASFVAALAVGHFLGCTAIFGIAWFVAWVIACIVKRHIFETPLMFNLVIAAFVFGSLLPSIGHTPHTDTALANIGRQTGFAGLAATVLLLCLLLRASIKTARRTSHPFAFYICTGITTVTAVQFMLASLDSMGAIPPTGVSVPFLSYGRTGMILNIAAFGIILSYSHTDLLKALRERERGIARAGDEPRKTVVPRKE